MQVFKGARQRRRGIFRKFYSVILSRAKDLRSKRRVSTSEIPHFVRNDILVKMTQ